MKGLSGSTTKKNISVSFRNPRVKVCSLQSFPYERSHLLRVRGGHEGLRRQGGGHRRYLRHTQDAG